MMCVESVDRVGKGMAVWCARWSRMKCGQVTLVQDRCGAVGAEARGPEGRGGPGLWALVDDASAAAEVGVGGTSPEPPKHRRLGEAHGPAVQRPRNRGKWKGGERGRDPGRGPGERRSTAAPTARWSTHLLSDHCHANRHLGRPATSRDSPALHEAPPSVVQPAPPRPAR